MCCLVLSLQEERWTAIYFDVISANFERFFNMRFLIFDPIYQERVWGGRGLATKLGRSITGDAPIGESWELVDREDEQSVVAAGRHAGRSLREMIESMPEWVMGPDWPKEKRFPLLVKWLDCQQRLSLQVHPPADVAPELGGEPKTENWFIADAEDGAGLIAGLKKGVSREQFEAALRNNSLEGCVHRFEVQSGESIFVPSGRIHAIDGGNLILEIQQNSDTTYRVYDWGRVGLDGKARQLHIEESLKSIDFDDFEPSSIKPGHGLQLLAECDEFRLRKFDLSVDEGEALVFEAAEEPRMIGVVEGQIREKSDGSVISRGANVLLPYGERFEFVAEAEATLVVSDRFARP